MTWNLFSNSADDSIEGSPHVNFPRGSSVIPQYLPSSFDHKLTTPSVYAIYTWPLLCSSTAAQDIVGSIQSGQSCLPCTYTCFWRDLTGRLRVSENWRFFGRFGFEDGVWIAQHRINIAIKMTKVMPIKSTAHQNSWNIWQNVSEIFKDLCCTHGIYNSFMPIW